MQSLLTPTSGLVIWLSILSLVLSYPQQTTAVVVQWHPLVGPPMHIHAPYWFILPFVKGQNLN